MADLRTGVADLKRSPGNCPDHLRPGQTAEAVQAIRAAVTALVGSGMDDDEVRHFIEAAARGGTHVQALTPAVLEWMRRSGIEKSFKIIAGGRPVTEAAGPGGGPVPGPDADRTARGGPTLLGSDRRQFTRAEILSLISDGLPARMSRLTSWTRCSRRCSSSRPRRTGSAAGWQRQCACWRLCGRASRTSDGGKAHRWSWTSGSCTGRAAGRAEICRRRLLVQAGTKSRPPTASPSDWSAANVRIPGAGHREILAALRSGTDRGVMVTAGTGAGKSLAFYLPALCTIGESIADAPAHGVRCLAIYPRNELLKDQFTRSCSARDLQQARATGRPIVVGTWFGATPSSAQSVIRGQADGWAEVRREAG